MTAEIIRAEAEAAEIAALLELITSACPA